jgi:hypothetical protein
MGGIEFGCPGAGAAGQKPHVELGTQLMGSKVIFFWRALPIAVSYRACAGWGLV